MITQRYWGLFAIALGMAAHSFVVGRLLGSSFFMLLFFWGWVAFAAYRGMLDSARSMAIIMMVIMALATGLIAFGPSHAHNELAYYAIALYPAMVSWICVFFYIRHLQQRDGAVLASRGRRGQRQVVKARGAVI